MCSDRKSDDISSRPLPTHLRSRHEGPFPTLKPVGLHLFQSHCEEVATLIGISFIRCHTQLRGKDLVEH